MGSMMQLCHLFPLYVAPNGGAGQVGASEFAPWLPMGFQSCPAQVIGARPIGASGFSVSTVNP